MGNHNSRKPSKSAYRTHSATSASGASQKRGQTLLPMLIGGLLLIVFGMLTVVLLVSN